MFDPSVVLKTELDPLELEQEPMRQVLGTGQGVGPLG
jgi:hypothetical protein